MFFLRIAALSLTILRLFVGFCWRVGCAAWLATARYRIGRLQYIGVPREAVVARIQQAQFRAQETAQGRAQRLYEPLPSHADFFGYQALAMAQRVAAVGA